MWLLKTDSQGDTLWTRTYGGYQTDHSLSMDVTQDGCYLVAGYTASFGAGNNDFYLVKTEPDFGVEEHGVGSLPMREISTTICRGLPDVPADVDYVVYDLNGRKRFPHSLIPGMYFIEIEGRVAGKFMIVR